MLVAGHDTTGYTLAWTLIEVARHPEVLAQLQVLLTGGRCNPRSAERGAALWGKRCARWGRTGGCPNVGMASRIRVARGRRECMACKLSAKMEVSGPSRMVPEILSRLDSRAIPTGCITLLLILSERKKLSNPSP
jgi:hypothetical protein